MEHRKDVVYETAEEKQFIERAVHNILEEDLEHDELGMKQHRHEKPVTWKQAEQDIANAETDEPPSLPAGPSQQKSKTK